MSVTVDCPVHGTTKGIERRNRVPDCGKCNYDRVKARRHKVKRDLVAIAGGRCAICGYDRCIRAMEFHHLDPATKSFTISSNRATIAFDRLAAEAEKCVLLCSNCHAEVEDGMVSVSKASGELVITPL